MLLLAAACGRDGLADSEFCRTARQQSERVEDALDRSRDPDKDPRVFQVAREAFTAVQAQAPEKIAPTVDQLVTSLTALDQALAAVSYDVNKLSAEQKQQLVDNPELDAATERFRKFVDDEC